MGMAPVNAAVSNLTCKAELTLRETYDNNVYILNTEPRPGIVPPAHSLIAEPNKESFVTTVTPALRLSYRANDAFTAGLSYAPDVVRYHSASSEDYVAHRGSISFQGRIEDASYEWLNSVVWVDGNNLTPTVLRPGDCRAIGGIPLRDRRDQAVYRNGFKLKLDLGEWFIRPVVNAYVHDFQTELRPNTNTANFLYENYIDRWEVSGGMDVGRDVGRGTWLVAGYRFGRQHQAALLGRASPYSNRYHRLLAGMEGSPVSWLKVAVLGGPDWRCWDSETPAGFQRDELLWFLDGSITLLPTRADTVILKATRYEQPAFTSHSVYEDIRYELSWRHRFNDRFTAGAGLTLYIGDWQAPVHREDWIITPNAIASYAFNRHLSAEASYSYDAVENRVPTSAPGATYAEGREFTRQMASLAIKYSF